MKPVDAIREIRDEMIADAKTKADAMAKAAVRAEAEAMYKLAKNGMKREEIAALFECGVATVHRRIRLHTEENNIARGAGGKIRRERSECGAGGKLRREQKVEEKQDYPLLDNKHEVADLQDDGAEYSAPDKAVIAEGWKVEDGESWLDAYERLHESYRAWNDYGRRDAERKMVENALEMVSLQRHSEYRKWCKAHKDQHEAINYFRLLNKRIGGVINLNMKIDTNLQSALAMSNPHERENILRYATKFNIRFRK
mgnify:CR=1 FL=1